jgi:CDP-glycerol glycerophosphotransferase (TagB/SpsB family)
MIHPVNLLLGGSAISKGGKVVLFNHGTTSYNKYAVSRKVQALWQSMGRSVSNFANVYIAKTPYARDFIHKEYHKQAEILQLYADEKYTITPSTNKDFTLLYANTLMPFQNHVPWIYETSFEYLESLKTLCEAVIKTEGIKLIIRHRATSDLDNEITEEVLKYFLPKSDKITFDDKRSFEDAINHSDMLVSSLSVTIDEALNMRKPVLLHSYDNRYAHLDAMAEPPSEYNRSAVYRRRDSVTLEHLLTELAKQHKGRELIDKEIVHYIFPPNEGSMSNLVAHVTKQPA